MDTTSPFSGRNALPSVAPGLAQEAASVPVDGEDQSAKPLVLDLAGEPAIFGVSGIDAALFGDEELGVIAALTRSDFDADLHW
jgi:hypothetical protein